MKKISLLLLALLFSSTLYSFGNDSVKINIEQCEDGVLGNNCDIVGYKLCLKDNINAEVIKTNKSGYKWVLISCLPSYTPLVKYWFTDKNADAYLRKIKGNYKKCLSIEGIENCPNEN